MSTADHADIAALLKGQTPVGKPRHRPRLGPHAPRLQGRAVVHPRARRLVLRPDSGRGAGAAAELRERGQEADLGMRGDRQRRPGAEPGAGPGGRGAGRRRRSGRVGRRPRGLSDSAEARVVRVPARGGAPAAAHQHARRGRARAPLPQHGDPPLLPRARLLLGAHADHHGQRCRGRRRDVPRQHARPRQPVGDPAHAGRAHRLQPGLLRQAKRSSPSAASSTSRPTASRCRRSTPSARRSAPRTATPAATSPSSGWSSPRSRSPICTPTPTWPSRSSSTSSRRC